MGTFCGGVRLSIFACIFLRAPDGVFVPVRGVTGKMRDLPLR
jgi:hypothetical protein